MNQSLVLFFGVFLFNREKKSFFMPLTLFLNKQTNKRKMLIIFFFHNFYRCSSEPCDTSENWWVTESRWSFWFNFRMNARMWIVQREKNTRKLKCAEINHNLWQNHKSTKEMIMHRFYFKSEEYSFICSTNWVFSSPVGNGFQPRRRVVERKTSI